MEKPISPSSIPPVLTFYRGGLNVGLFQQGPPIYPQGSEVFGNPNFENSAVGNPYTYRVQSLDPGEKNYGWILILSGKDSLITMKRYGENKSSGIFSEYDGLYNKSILTTRGKATILQYNESSYKDWYIPSRDELAFISKNLPLTFSLDSRFNAMSKFYVSSTYIKNSVRKQNFLYQQSFMSDTYGVTSLVEDIETVSVRYVRRVPVKLI